MKSNYLTEMTDIYTRLGIGEHVHVPFNMIFQGIDETHAAGVFQFQAEAKLIKQLTSGADLNSNHVLWLGDAFFRPKLITQSKHLMGNGISGIYKTGFNDVEFWAEHGTILKGEETLQNKKSQYA
jgi:hypothetical protein